MPSATERVAIVTEFIEDNRPDGATVSGLFA